MTSPDAKVVQWRPRDGPARRIEFERVAEGYRRSERVRSGDCRGWRTVGVETVASISFSGIGPSQTGTTIRGP